MPYANNKGKDQPMQPHSLISIFVFRCLDSRLPIHVAAVSKLPRPLKASVNEHAGLSVTWSHNSDPNIKGKFSHDTAQCSFWKMTILLTCLKFIKIIQFLQMSQSTRKPVFGVFDQVRFKPACSATETSQTLEISDIETRDIILSRQ